MSNDDKRRRQDGSPAKLSVAELLARREAETQPIPRITDNEETVRFSAAGLSDAANLSGRELHITELLRREGRAGEEERGGGGFSVPKLVAMASGGVVLAGTVAFTASNLMSSPDERPLAEVRFDARPAARATSTLTKDLSGPAAQQQETQQAQAGTTTTTPEQAPERTPTPHAQQGATQQDTTQQPTSTTTQQPTTQSGSSQQTTPPGTSSTAPTSSSTPPPSSSSTPSSSTPPSSTSPSTPPPSEEPGTGLELDLDLGGILEPIGGFDFFAPAG